MARRYRLRIIDADIQVSGTRLMGGKMAVADVLTIGSLTVRNVVFAVLDMTAGNERARRVAQQISLVIGQPLLQLFGSYTIDFASRQIHLTHQSHRSGAAPNLFFNKVPYVAVTRDSLRMAMALDTGAATSSLDNAYYKAFAADPQHRRHPLHPSPCGGDGALAPQPSYPGLRPSGHRLHAPVEQRDRRQCQHDHPFTALTARQ